MNSQQFLQGRVAVVCGGATGIGQAIARALAAAGARIAIGSRSAPQRSCTAELEALGVKAIALPLDLCSATSVQEFLQTVRSTLGSVDILVNSAGITAEQPVLNHPDELWEQIINVNLHGVYRTIKSCLPEMMAQRWGRIINLASTAASVGSPTNPAYCASKAAVVGLTKCVALEGAPYGITCNAISPGWVETDFGKRWMQQIAQTNGQTLDDYLAAQRQSNPQQRMIQPEEIGALATFLCSEGAIGITMQDLVVSAGSLW